ncbi:MAG: hypothetical protein LBL55_04950 [Propionibacteriaceae bacterium]|nr:hypothetical protein [Propionibacteriaceae bacterium]
MACQQRTQSQFTHGYKIHSILGVLTDTVTNNGDSWFWKVKTDVTNQYGASQSGVLECVVGGPDSAPVIEGFDFY